MVQEISLRDVGNDQIYDSYMGILRISPSKLDEQLTDSMSLFLTNPIDVSDKERQAILSDSDGIKLGAYFTSKVRTTKVKNTDGKDEEQDVINVVSHATTYLFSSNSLNIRSTLVVNKEKQETKTSPIQIYHESVSRPDVFDVLLYPVDSPNDASYFNAENKLDLIDYNISKDVHTQLNEALYNKSKKWYDDNITTEHRVKIGGDFVYTQNKDYEQVPILYTKDYILGHYRGHTARVTDNIKSKFIETTVGPERLQNNTSIVTKLSFIRLDSLVWDVLHEALQGNIRHSEGRYSFLGLGENESITERLFGTVNPPEENAPILGAGVSPGIVISHVMPFRRFIFHVLRQEIRNSAEEENDYENLRNGVKQYIEDKKITPIAKLDPGFVNPLTKEFVLCDGKELTYDNYPSVNTDNKNLFQHDEIGRVKRDDQTKKPIKVEPQTELYNALASSNNSTAPDDYKNKVITPSLLPLNQKSPRYIRGLNWIEETHEYSPDKVIDFLTELKYKNNEKDHEVVLNSDYGLTKKNFTEPGVYRMQADWKVTGQHHKHRCFFNSATWNRSNPSRNNSGSFAPVSFDVTNNMKNASAKTQLMDYSFVKHAVVSGQTYQNRWQGGLTPVPFAGVFAWKLTNETTQTADNVKDTYVIQNSEQTPISTDEDERLTQIELINSAEGMAPIANKGGGVYVSAYTTGIYCSHRHNLHKHRHFAYNYQPLGGAYNILKATEAAGSDVPRCVTSLPHQDPEKEASKYEPPYKMTIGDQEIEPDMNLSFPPTTVLLPLFKI